MDLHANVLDRLKSLEREVAYLRERESQFYSRYSAQMAHTRIVKLARTIEEFDGDGNSTYPAQGASNANIHFPIVFLSAGHLNQSSSTAYSVTAHDTTAQTFVYSLSHNWISPSTTIEVWQDVGVDSAYPGNWWTLFRDPVRIGVTTTTVNNLGNGYVDEYDTDDYREETVIVRNWKVRNWCGYDLAANTPVFFTQRRGVAYIINAACEAAGSGFGSG